MCTTNLHATATRVDVHERPEKEQTSYYIILYFLQTDRLFISSGLQCWCPQGICERQHTYSFDVKSTRVSPICTILQKLVCSDQANCCLNFHAQESSSRFQTQYLTTLSSQKGQAFKLLHTLCTH